MLQRWSRISWKWFMFWKACNKQNTWECWVCTGCNQRRLATDSVRTRSWSGDSKNHRVWDFDAGSWHEMCQAKFIPLLLLPEQKEHRAAVGRTVWGPKVPALKGTEASLSYVQCFLYLVSSSINVSIFHTTWLDASWTDLVDLCSNRDAFTAASPILNRGRFWAGNGHEHHTWLLLLRGCQSRCRHTVIQWFTTFLVSRPCYTLKMSEDSKELLFIWVIIFWYLLY